MKNLLTIFAAFVLLIGAMFISGDTRNVSAQTGSDLISLLPASDAVATINLKRLLSDAVPQLMSSQPAQLAKLNAKIDAVKAKTGIDLRQFEQAAVGINFKQIRAGTIEAEPVLVIRGNIKTAELLAVGKIAAGGKFRQEQIGGKTVTIFSLPETVKETTKQTGHHDAMIEKAMDKIMSGEFAVYAVDTNTLAAGKLPQVRSMLLDKTAKNHVAADLTELVKRNPNAVTSFAGNVPAGLAASFDMDDDQIGRMINSLRQMFGSIDMNDGTASMLLAARTSQEPQAQEIEESLLGLQMLGKGLLSSRSDDKSQVLTRILENLKITRNTSEVQLQANVSNSDINKLVTVPASAPTPAATSNPQSDE
ncbi:MAG: hypothetical protein ABI954_08460 [Pyrinomonadaceae bacterium]